MSHIVKVDIEIRDLDAADRAARAIGAELRRDQTSYTWYGRSVGDYPLPDGITADMLGKCDHAIGIPGNSAAYEIGLVADSKGGYSMLWDFWNRGYGLQDVVGDNCSTFCDQYAVEAAVGAAEQLGWQTERITDGVRIYHPTGGHVDVVKGSVEAHDFSGQGCQQATEAIAAALGQSAETQVKAEFYESQNLNQQLGE